MVARRGFSEHVIYDDGMRRRTPLVIGALEFAGAAVASGAYAETDDTTTTVPEPTTTTRRSTTTTPAVTPTDPPATTPTKPAPTTTSSTLRNGGNPIPPPASGASQPLDPSLLGGLPGVELNPSTTTPFFSTEDGLTTTTVFSDDNAISVSKASNGPTGATLALASVAWLASLGGLLVYAEDQRAKQWRHLAR